MRFLLYLATELGVHEEEAFNSPMGASSYVRNSPEGSPVKRYQPLLLDTYTGLGFELVKFDKERYSSWVSNPEVSIRIKSG
jgi:hypothetical protein